ncbi:hypothetical protein [Bosea sp. (in: a-proteobacteria)]|jgi:hypothetical protein|uniref:hypothetical protein n=1 Tax=Bosea sp. (in: a-proteobacteria) TaxID=1871050 RepID=UPI003F714FD0
MLLLAIVGGVAWYFGDAACHIPRHREALRIREAAGCVEFWTNRYQSGIGGLLALLGGVIAGGMALAAAMIAAAPVVQQLRVSERQTALLALPLLREMITAEETEEEKRKLIERNLETIKDFFALNDQGALQYFNMAMSISSITLNFVGNIDHYSKHITANPRGLIADEQRKQVVTLSRLIITTVNDLRTIGDARRVEAISEAQFDRDISEVSGRFAAQHQALIAALREACQAGEDRRSKLSAQIGLATELALS